MLGVSREHRNDLGEGVADCSHQKSDLVHPQAPVQTNHAQHRGENRQEPQAIPRELAIASDWGTRQYCCWEPWS